jgi:Zn-dependent protease
MAFREWIGHHRMRLFRAPVYIHWSVFAGAAVIALLSLGEPAHAAVAIVSYLMVILVHECGHAWMARRRGCGVVSIRIGLFHGRCEHEADQYDEWDDVAIAWGGVLAQLAVAIPMLVLARFTTPQMLGPFGVAVSLLAGANLVIALFNLLPAPGFDGDKAWRIAPLAYDWWRSRRVTRRALRKWTRR